MTTYEAIVNLSVPRKGDPGRETDLVYAHETVELTDDVAALFLPPLRNPPVIRLAKETGPAPVLLARHLSGVKINPRTGQRVGHPGPPEGARPDPPGSSTIQTVIPESAEPQLDDETRAPGPDAEDIAPRRAARAGR